MSLSRIALIARRSVLTLAIASLFVGLTRLHAQVVYDLTATLANGDGSISGQFTVTGSGSTFSLQYTNVDLTVTGAGSDAGDSFTVTTDDDSHEGGEVFQDGGINIDWQTELATPLPATDGFLPGSAVILGGGGVGISSGEITEVTSAATPEPGTASTLALGLLGLAGAACRRLLTHPAGA
jgi:hypothetical protein